MSKDPNIPGTRLQVSSVAVWPEEQIQRKVDQTIEHVGGERAFRWVGRRARGAVIEACAWKALKTSASGGSVILSQTQMHAVETAMFRAAGILGEQ